MSLVPPFGNAAFDFAGAQLAGAGQAGPSSSGDIRGGNVDFGTFNIPGITRGFDLGSPIVLGVAAIVAVAIIIAMKK